MGKKQVPSKSYVVVYRLEHDGETYNRGDSVEMNEEQAAQLIKDGILIEEGAQEPSTPPSDPPSDPPADPPTTDPNQNQ